MQGGASRGARLQSDMSTPLQCGGPCRLTRAYTHPQRLWRRGCGCQMGRAALCHALAIPHDSAQVARDGEDAGACAHRPSPALSVLLTPRFRGAVLLASAAALVGSRWRAHVEVSMRLPATCASRAILMRRGYVGRPWARRCPTLGLAGWARAARRRSRRAVGARGLAFRSRPRSVCLLLLLHGVDSWAELRGQSDCHEGAAGAHQADGIGQGLAGTCRWVQAQGRACHGERRARMSKQRHQVSVATGGANSQASG